MKIAFVLGFAFVCALTANATLISSTGQVSVVAPPPDVRVNIGDESNSTAFFFTEQQDFVLPSAVNVNITVPGLYSTTGSLTPGTIASGTLIDSYYVHADPVGATTNVRVYNGSLKFSTDVLGVIVTSAQLSATNALLGHPGTLYSASNQGLEFSSQDSVNLAGDRRTLSLHLVASNAADDIRIITAGSVLIPEPATWVLVASCGAFLLVRRRRAG